MGSAYHTISDSQECYFDHQVDLSRKSIRLIHLHHLAPGESSDTTELSCDMTVAILDSNIRRYAALSYTWGQPYKSRDSNEADDDNQPSIQKTISIDGHHLKIGKNLFDALIDLRDSCSVLWVDALCINQKDIIEKNHQIQLMGDIYSHAHIVLVWLGPPRDVIAAALRLWKALGDHYGRVEVNSHENAEKAPAAKSTSDARHPGWIEEGIVDDTSSSSEEGSSPNFFGELFRCSWFTRVWTLQEALYARSLAIRFNKEYIHLNANDIKVASLMYLRWDLFVPKSRVACRQMQDSSPEGLARMFDLQCFSADFQKCDSPWRPPIVRLNDSFVQSLERLLLNKSNSEATDPRDHVFANIAIALRFRQNSEDIIEPDYGKTAKQVYLEATNFIATKLHSINIIAHARKLNTLGTRASNVDLTGLPSWVPRFNQQGILFVDPSMFSAMKSKKHLEEHGPADEQMEVEGFAVGHGLIYSRGCDCCDEIERNFLRFLKLLRPAYVGSGSEYMESELVLYIWLLLVLRVEAPGDHETVDLESMESQNLGKYRTSTLSLVWEFAASIIVRRLLDHLLSMSGVHIDSDQGSLRHTAYTAALPAIRPLLPRGLFLRIIGQDELPSDWEKLVLDKLLQKPCEWEQRSERILKDAVQEARSAFICHNISNSNDIDEAKPDMHLFLGSSCWEQHETDQLWFLAGLNVPVILRPLPNGHYRLIGPVYVNCHMNGTILETEWATDERKIILE